MDGEEAAQQKAVRRACKIIEQNPSIKTVNDLAEEVGLSTRYFHSIFKNLIGITPGEYLKLRKGTTDLVVDEVSSTSAGYNEPAELSTNIRLVSGSPMEEHVNHEVCLADMGAVTPLSLPQTDQTAACHSGQKRPLLTELSAWDLSSLGDNHFLHFGSQDSSFSISNLEWLAQNNLFAIGGGSLTSSHPASSSF